MESLSQEIVLAWLGAHFWQIFATGAMLVAYVLFERYGSTWIAQGADQSRFRSGVALRAPGVARLIIACFALLALIVVWGVELSALLIFATTTITLLGVALFASWSLLSNITAFFVLLLHPSFRRGNFVRIIDADNYVEGYIAELTIFNTRLVTENRETVIYPNNQLLGKPVLINPRDRLNGVGKLQPPAAAQEKDEQAPARR